MMFAPRDIVLFALVAGALAAAALALWPWARAHGRFLAAGGATTIGFVAWNLILNASNARSFNVDAPIIGLSWADGGSGVFAFLVTALVLGLVLEPREAAGRVVGAAAIAGLLATLVDLFVL
jgi:hypothetical protein